ncbi:MAG: peptidase U32 [Firmicutes bacterium HGW-Firmicutes-9]|jgi:putative protease|nr:MAG: peptidase U32 [Firmicutes bacterium HGW-Firmicutes-9]
MQTPEILSPVGGEEQLIAAVRCGANAVYLGGQNFNARRNAANFAETDLTKAVSYCHARGVKVYVTVNTIVLDAELSALEEEADRIAQSGADAVIIQDIAVLRLFQQRYPTLKRFASTQTAVHNVDGARFLESVGFDNIVLARELSLEEIATICASVSIQKEAFIHGAHCMSVSGACYLSAMLGGRSGNRGLCAQPCRLNWTSGDHPYALSLKDMSLLPHLQELAKAGVNSFKIEGRMKRPEYVAAATAACKLALEGKPYDAESLRAVFSRSGFTDGYLAARRDGQMFGYRTKEDVTGADGVLGSLAALYRNETPLVPVDLHFKLDETHATLTVSDGAHSITTEGGAPERAIHRALDKENAKKNLEKTGGTPFFVRSFTAEITDGYTMPASALNAMRREALDALLELRGQPQPHKREDYEITAPARYLSQREKPALWARFYQKDQIACTDSFEKIILPAEEIDAELIAALGDQLIAQLPTVLFPEDEPAFDVKLEALASQGLSAVWANNIYGINLGKRLGLTVHGGYGLNCTNTEAVRFYETQDLASLTLSFELSMNAIKSLGGTISRGIVSYGSLPLMQLRNCPIKASIGCADCGQNGALTDRMHVRFPVECDHYRTVALLNSVPLDIAERNMRGLDHQILYFTRETPQEISAVTERFIAGEKTDEPHTTGLYYRPLL